MTTKEVRVPPRPTMRDIAAAAGVSPSAVSLALAGKGRMEDSTRARILATATELGYRINREARALRTGRTMMIGLVTSMVADQVDDHESRLDWYTRTALAAANESFRHGYALVLVPPLGEHDQVHDLAADGVLLIDPDPAEGFVETAAARGLAVVTIGGHAPAPASSVSLDRDAAVDLAMTHFLSTGARRPALLVDNSGRQNAAASRTAYEHWCDIAGMTPIVATVDFAGGGGRTRLAHRACVQLLTERPDVDAVYAPLDSVAAGCVTAARELGRTIGADLGLITSEGSIARDNDPPLTAIDTHREEQAAAAVRMLVTALASGERPPNQTFLPSLIVR
ncbi:LacI family DNA-binding transcriptional regulator [Nocardia salmonicida]|uniref:LacI family DNA-binding transcriptional regulator n=1 Tax=Nocardia salmonicida TaxID=53431 RepID=UPI002E2938C6|nr:LacI family DNA-binding transcriptional regulator [Nocardia salmonicida]